VAKQQTARSRPPRLPACLACRCGVEYDVKPFLKRVEQGMDPDAAWKEAQPEIQASMVRGTWLRDAHITGPDSSGKWCHLREIQ
jgi:hypothetical protein